MKYQSEKAVLDHLNVRQIKKVTFETQVRMSTSEFERYKKFVEELGYKIISVQ